MESQISSNGETYHTILRPRSSVLNEQNTSAVRRNMILELINRTFDSLCYYRYDIRNMIGGFRRLNNIDMRNYLQLINSSIEDFNNFLRMNVNDERSDITPSEISDIISNEINEETNFTPNVSTADDLRFTVYIMYMNIKNIMNGSYHINSSPTIHISHRNVMIHNINNIMRHITDNISNGIPFDIFNYLPEKICLSDSDDSCAICLQNYKEKEVLTILFCDHSFHKDCVKIWLEKNNNCPVCRKVLKV